MADFRKMRRARQEMTKEECLEILERCSEGVLSLLGDDDYPYGVPMNYFYENGKLYFHCAKTGHKIDAIKKHDKVSFCVIDKHEVLPEIYATRFTSVIAFGRARLMDDPKEMYEVVQRLALKFCPGDEDGVRKETDREFSALAMIEVTIEHMTGKKAKNILEGYGL